jgi:hypothetical protein
MQKTLFRPPNIYCLDTNIFINLKNYPSDVFKGLWVKLDKAIQDGLIISDEEVYNELVKGKDDISTWAKKHRAMFKNHIEETFITVEDILKNHPTIVDVDKEGFDADPFLIAQAKIYEAVLVTGEKPKKVGSTRDKIPDVCQAYGIRYIDGFTMFRELGWEF